MADKVVTWEISKSYSAGFVKHNEGASAGEKAEWGTAGWVAKHVAEWDGSAAASAATAPAPQPPPVDVRVSVQGEWPIHEPASVTAARLRSFAAQIREGPPNEAAAAAPAPPPLVEAIADGGGDAGAEAGAI